MVAVVSRPTFGVQHAGHPSPPSSQFELRFTPLFDAGRGYAFPCDAAGNVDIDILTERARANYFYARTTVGRDFRTPTMRRVVDGGLK